MPSPTGGQVSTSTTLLRVVLLADGERVDLAVNPDARLADVLHTAGMNVSGRVATAPAGRRVALVAPLADEVTERQILAVVPDVPPSSGAAGPTGSGAGRYQRLPAVTARWGVCALGVALAAVMVLTHLATMVSPTAYPRPVATGMPILLAALAVVLAVRQGPPGRQSLPSSVASPGRSLPLQGLRPEAVGIAAERRVQYVTGTGGGRVD